MVDGVVLEAMYLCCQCGRIRQYVPLLLWLVPVDVVISDSTYPSCCGLCLSMWSYQTVCTPLVAPVSVNVVVSDSTYPSCCACVCRCGRIRQYVPLLLRLCLSMWSYQTVCTPLVALVSVDVVVSDSMYPSCCACVCRCGRIRQCVPLLLRLCLSMWSYQTVRTPLVVLVSVDVVVSDSTYLSCCACVCRCGRIRQYVPLLLCLCLPMWSYQTVRTSLVVLVSVDVVVSDSTYLSCCACVCRCGRGAGCGPVSPWVGL